MNYVEMLIFKYPIYPNMLDNCKLKSFIPTTHPAEARQFYGALLGFDLLSEDRFALEFDAHGHALRVTVVPQLHPHPFTVLGLDVLDIKTSMRALTAKGIVFERFGTMKQDEAGVWKAPGGTLVAWFKDPDGNLLSISQTA